MCFTGMREQSGVHSSPRRRHLRAACGAFRGSGARRDHGCTRRRRAPRPAAERRLLPGRRGRSGPAEAVASLRAAGLATAELGTRGGSAGMEPIASSEQKRCLANRKPAAAAAGAFTVVAGMASGSGSGWQSIRRGTSGTCLGWALAGLAGARRRGAVLGRPRPRLAGGVPHASRRCGSVVSESRAW